MPYSDQEKQKAYLAQHYKTNKSQYIESSKAARQRRMKKMQELKDKPCTDCGIKYPYYVMQWDHTEDNKVASVSKLMTLKSWDTILKEVAKCELVCANCHAERTFGLRRK